MIYVGVPTCVWAGAGNTTFHLPEDDFYRHIGWKSWTPLSSQAHSPQLTFTLYCNGALSWKFHNNIAINGYLFLMNEENRFSCRNTMPKYQEHPSAFICNQLGDV